jgi:hypothetical protein
LLAGARASSGRDITIGNFIVVLDPLTVIDRENAGNPACVARTVYAPGFTATKVNLPAASDTARETSRPMSFSVTTAPATGTSCPSTTEPLMVVVGIV